ncbi:MAG: hypothetical protein HRT72_04895, partial [Flavobacteriales bacterium]|nr:hypothetical protein [Flavobacteriales bacterium]
HDSVILKYAKGFEIKKLHFTLSRLSNVYNSSLSVSILVRDVTDFYTNQEFKKEASAMKKSIRFKDEFLANMSHEIRTPLNGILGMLELLEKTTNVTDKQLEILSVIRSSSNTLLSIIDDILDMAKIEAGKMKMLLNPVNIESLIMETINLFKPKANEKSIAN